MIIFSFGSWIWILIWSETPRLIDWFSNQRSKSLGLGQKWNTEPSTEQKAESYL
jgi:hypothetical protein